METKASTCIMMETTPLLATMAPSDAASITFTSGLNQNSYYFVIVKCYMNIK